MEETFNERNEWVGILSFVLGAAVIVPSMIVLAITILTVLFRIF